MTSKLPEFKGKPLIEIPKHIPQIGSLEGDFGKEFLNEYNGRVENSYKSNSNLDVLSYNSNVVKGSNPFAVVLANQILNEENLRTATQADLEKALKSGFDLRGTYEDTALVLRTVEDSYTKNTPIAKDLAYQLKERGAEFSPENPLVLPLNQLTLQNSDNDYGLTFKLKDDSEFYNAPILKKDGSFNSEDINIETGLPKKVEEGNRNLWTRDSGLSRLHLVSDLGVFSGDRDLDVSGSSGRVVVVSGEAARTEDLQSELYNQIENEYKSQLEFLDSKKSEAEKAVRDIMSRK